MAVRLTVVLLLLIGAASIASSRAEARTRPRVSLTASTRQADLGEKILFSGRVRPNRTGEAVFIQLLSQDRWRNLAHTSLASGSRFSLLTGLHSAGVLRLRALYPGDAATRQGHSPPTVVSVVPVPVGIHKIKHVVVIMQENRSFDEYFGTYPGADGFPPGTCVPDPVNGGCIAPYYNPEENNKGGPHASPAFEGDLNGGAMNGFVAEAEQAQNCQTPGTTQCQTDVIGYGHGRAALQF